MIIHDFSTTISCDRCSDEVTVVGNFSNRKMQKYAEKHGWKIIAGECICPKCNMKDEIKAEG